jgi:hypothetical protein
MPLSTTLAREQVLSEISKAINKPVDELKPFKDYNPIEVDENVRRLTSPPGIRYAGD